MFERTLFGGRQIRILREGEAPTEPHITRDIGSAGASSSQLFTQIFQDDPCRTRLRMMGAKSLSFPDRQSAMSVSDAAAQEDTLGNPLLSDS
ncbi:MAG: hypothetical protein ACI8P0_006627 [Planctomycetaceae bacterium]|jgi:hypothetical protein